MGAEVNEGGAVRELISDQGGRGAGQQHLAPWPTAMILTLRIIAGPK
jgi:hypothetical protein